MQEMKKRIKHNDYLLIKILVIALLFVLLSIIFYYVSSAFINGNYEDMLIQSMSQEQKAADNFFSYLENITNTLSRNTDLPIYKTNNRILRANILSLYESINIADSRISNIYYVSNDGTYIAFDNKKNPNHNLTQTSWFKKTVEGKTRTIWISHKSDFTGADVISCLRQILDKYGSPKGVVGLDIKLFKISELVENIKIGKKGFLMILDSGNKVIAHPNNTYLGVHISDRNLMNRSDRVNDKSYVLKIKNKRFRCRESQIEKLPWRFIYAVPVNEIILNTVQWTALFILLSIVSFTIVLLMIRANEKLKEHASTIEELAVSKERNRLARDVHDTLGQTLGLLITLLQVSILSGNKDSKETEKNLNKAVEIAKEGLNEVRRSISGLVPEDLERNSLFDALGGLINDYKNLGMKVELSVNKLEQNLDHIYSETIYRVCQEALTNAVKHGKAGEASIVLKFTDSRIKLFIFDNGFGCKDIGSTKGFGLKGMKQRVEKLNGEIKFGSDGEKGFNVHVEIPITK